MASSLCSWRVESHVVFLMLLIKAVCFLWKWVHMVCSRRGPLVLYCGEILLYRMVKNSFVSELVRATPNNRE